MKNVLTIGLLFLLSGIYAQDIEINDVELTISKGTQPGVMMDIPAADKDQVEKAWISTLENNTKSKVSIVNNNEISILNANIEEIKDSLNIYSVLYEYPDKVQLAAFFELPDGFTGKENKYEYLAAKEFLRKFGESVYYNALQENLEAEEDKLKSLEKEYKKLLKGNEKIHKKINKAQRDIEKVKNEIETGKLDQQRVRKQIQEKKDQLTGIKDEALREVEEKNLKGLEKQLSKLERKNDKRHKKVDKCESKVRELNRELDNGEGEFTRKKKEVEAQKEIVYDLQAKLKSIK